jgi:hypothetical protein
MAVIVTSVVPVTAVVVAENETVMMQSGLQGLFVKVAVTPVGKVDVDKVKGTEAPLMIVAVIEEVGLVEPWTTVRLLGEGTPRLKSKGAGLTFNEMNLL